MRNQMSKQTALIPLVLLTIFILSGFTVIHKSKAKIAQQNINRELIGVWQDQKTHGNTTIKDQDGTLVVVSVEASDGEKYVVLESKIENGNLKWSYKVPSTGYVLNMEVTSVSGDVMNCHWSNSTASGMQDFKRVN